MKLSIIIPTLGRAVLQETLQALSMCDQIHTINPQVCVIFNGSKNNESTKNFQEQLQKRYGKIFRENFIITSSGTTQGVSEARNHGIDMTDGDIIAFLGDDTIPEKQWLKRVYDFHVQNFSKTEALLGNIIWEKKWVNDPFHKWLESSGQFRFDLLKQGKQPNWRFFYTSNISLKRTFLEKERFSPEFSGWGFEDIELGYRLEKKGLNINFRKDVIVYHDHQQTLETFLSHVKNSRKNAIIFENKHPQVRIQPHGIKKLLLRILILISRILPRKNFPQIYWWRNWKMAWLDINIKNLL